MEKHLERRERLLKVLLFIVEGQSDEAALAPALEQIISTKKVKFKVMRADITADYASSVVNIEERIKNKAVKTFLKENPQFTSNDICEIVHIVDIDGAFIPNDKVEQADVEQMQYGEDRIICRDKVQYLKTKENKKMNLLHLSSLSEIKITNGIIVPYSVFYMSCNLDHVLHNMKNATINEKKANSIKFADNYDDPDKFIDFFNGVDIKIVGTYSETWEYIQKDLNSLKRGSNFWICIDEHKSIN